MFSSFEDSILEETFTVVGALPPKVCRSIVSAHCLQDVASFGPYIPVSSTIQPCHCLHCCADQLFSVPLATHGLYSEDGWKNN
jgi:hypothetical protein